MKTFRLIKKTDGSGIKYIIQRKSVFGFWFFSWFNPAFRSFNYKEEALRAIERANTSATKEIINL